MMPSWSVIAAWMVGCVLSVAHMALMVACAPVARGLLVAGMARLGGAGRVPVLARWRLILSCARRHGVRAAGGAEIVPALALAVALAACALVPSLALGLPGSGLADLLLVSGLLVLARLLPLLGALEPGGARAGLAAAGDAAALAAMQAVFPLAVAAAVMATGHGGIDALLTRLRDPDPGGGRVSSMLLAVAILLAGPDLGPGDEARAADRMVDLGGRGRAALELARDLALLAWITLAGDLAWPGGLAVPRAGDLLPAAGSLPGAVAAWLARTVAICAGIVAARVVVMGAARGVRGRLVLALLFATLAVVVLFTGQEVA
ncbi:hypothetical protein [Gluconacetobacter sacchari]|uniref:Formate hydrogenlyase subunit 4 n=1 Tax=Gluconacetobacter sacchari TaxID=92759 RepID=A0A7W4IFZ0_9PROT|nr:hypothetical protein [Gluconacetobacter sacchari]MBB2162158.1 hypothetical protein [Gluconacetobacter sacchari]